MSPQLVAQGQFTIIKQPLGFIKVLQWVSSVSFIFIIVLQVLHITLILMEEILKNISWSAGEIFTTFCHIKVMRFMSLDD